MSAQVRVRPRGPVATGAESLLPPPSPASLPAEIRRGPAFGGAGGAEDAEARAAAAILFGVILASAVVSWVALMRQLGVM